MKKILLSCFFIGLVILVSCNKETELDEAKPKSIVEKEPIAVVNGRLLFSTNESFETLIKESVSKKDPLLVYKRKGILNAGLFPLMGSPTISNGRVLIENDTIVDDLVPDEYFGRLLNKDRELQIGQTILKITPEGTFLCHVSKYNRLIEILNSNQKFGNEGAGSSKIIEDGIFFYDSFAAELPSEKIDFKSPPVKGKGSSNNRITFDYLPQSIYDGFDTHSFGSHTVVGGWIEGALGRREVQYIYFNSKERLKLNFYNVNYVVFSSIGITTQAQFKTWIGWGGDLKVQEIRMGWDGLSLEFPIPHAPSPGIPAVSFEKFKLGDLNIDVASFNASISDLLANTLPFMNTNQLAREINGEIDNRFSEIMKKTYNLVYQNVAPYQYDYYKRYVDQFRIMYPNKVQQVLGRYEEVNENAHKISKNFDWSTGEFGFSSDGTSFGLKNFGLVDKALTFKIRAASVYSAAKHHNVWKGIRIIKEK